MANGPGDSLVGQVPGFIPSSQVFGGTSSLKQPQACTNVTELDEGSVREAPIPFPVQKATHKMTQIPHGKLSTDGSDTYQGGS